MTAEERIRAKVVDWLLFNYPEVRAQLDAMTLEPKDVLFLGFQKSACSPVENLAIERARISVVTDAIERVYRSLPKRDRAIVGLYYFEKLTHKEAADKVNLPLRTYYRRVSLARQTFGRAIAALGDTQLRDFWRKVEELMEEPEKGA